jgi:hypothetical protein
MIWVCKIHNYEKCVLISEAQVKVKVKVNLEQGMKAQKGSRGIVLLFL